MPPDTAKNTADRHSRTVRILFMSAAMAVLSNSHSLAEDPPRDVVQDKYYAVRLSELTVTDGTLPMDAMQPSGRGGRGRPFYPPYVVLDRGEEGYVGGTQFEPRANPIPMGARLVVRAEHDEEVTGTIYVPQRGGRGMHRARFRISHDLASEEYRFTFQQVKAEYYTRLGRLGYGGAAWFRHQAQMKEPDDQQPRNRRPDESPLQRTFALFSGGRAVSENLQLDRELQVDPAEDTASVPVDTIEGITVQEIDWGPLIKDANPKLDPLARFIPFDQHAVFFSSFDAAVRVADEFRRNGRWVLSLAEPTSQSAEVMDFYEQQLCLSLNAVARDVAPGLTKSVAVTGSDPYFRTGTDVAVLFETPSPDSLAMVLLKRVRSQLASAGVDLNAGTVGTLEYHGCQSTSRSVSIYIAQASDLLIVTNSRYQLERLAGLLSGDVPSLASAPEYKFFRSRYRVGDPEEAAFVFLSDATIRRWCGPRWRIAASRRTRDAAVLAELQAQHIDHMAQSAGPQTLNTKWAATTAGTFELLDVGVHHSRTGNLRFMTPLAEMPLDRVSLAEKTAYEQWREQYQRNWRWAFDPIGIRFRFDERRISADLTVMPIILGSEYRRLVDVSQGVQLTAASGDPHDALLHYALAINKDSEPLQRSGSMLAGIMGLRNESPFSWLGSSISLYLDDGPFWKELAQLPADEEVIEERLPEMLDHLPLALYAEVSSGLRLAAFLTGVRTFIEQSAPGMTHWETRDYEGQPYVRVSLTERARRGMDALEDVALYYAPAGDSLTLTLDETVLHRALARAQRRLDAAGADKAQAPHTADWSGQNLALQVDRRIIDAVAKMSAESYHELMQARCWSNLPILNEWKRRYPDEDPVPLHRKLWHVELVCPGDGQYVWNDEWQTMESTVYGHPGHPRRGPSTPSVIGRLSRAVMGVTFENQGLRATMQLDLD